MKENTKIIVCPNKQCHTGLEIWDRLGVESISLTCPKCGERHNVGDYLSLEAYARLKKQRISITDTGWKESDQTTVVAQSGAIHRGQAALASDGYLLVRGENAISLAVGENIVGRKSKNSGATIQIEDPMNNMSREHFSIAVRQKNNAFTYTIKQKENAKNSSYLNQNLMEKGKEYELKEGDTFCVGSVVIVFKKK